MFKMLLTLIISFIIGKIIGLGVLGLLAWLFFEVLGGILTAIIDNWFIVLIATIVIPFALYWITMGLGKLMELLTPKNYKSKKNNIF